MKILFTGEVRGNAGPTNVNRGIAANVTPIFSLLNNENKYWKLAEGVLKTIHSDVVVISGVSRQECIFLGLAKMLGKKTVYIMHGCAAYEVVLNKQENMEKGLAQEEYLLENADLLLPVSKKFMKWVKDRYPQYANKICYLFNGIDRKIENSVRCASKVNGSVVAAGADRVVKNNDVVARVVEKMDGRAFFNIYGAIYHRTPNNYRFTRYVGVIPHDEYVRKLAESELFVLNSIFEPFSISAIEALQCGCSVLLSEVAGVTDILELEESDIIHDPMDEEEIRRKIEYLLECPNNERIMSKLDLDEWSYAKSVERLEKLCFELVHGK